jgi:hypothetical protein
MNTFIYDNQTLLLILALWTLPWKMYALWTAVKSGHKSWFIALVILNTFGILEIIYIFLIAKKKLSEMKKAFIRLISPKK